MKSVVLMAALVAGLALIAAPAEAAKKQKQCAGQARGGGERAVLPERCLCL